MWVKFTETLSLDAFVEVIVSLCSVMNLFKKRWLNVVRLARAKEQKHKNKDYVHTAFILCYNSS